MNAAARSRLAGAATISLILVAACVAPAPAGAALGTVGTRISGPGAAHRGAAVGVSVRLANTSTRKGITPDLISELGFQPHGVKFSVGATGVEKCRARVRKDGLPTRCPRRSQVGSGRIRAILGYPGAATDLFGPLSRVDGRFKLFNYTSGRGRRVRMLAVVVTRRPLGGMAIALVLTVDRAGVIRVAVPRLSSLPRSLAKAFPAQTKIVLTSLAVKIDVKRRIDGPGRPFARRTRSTGLGVTVWSTSPSGLPRPPQARGSHNARGFRGTPEARVATDRLDGSAEPVASGKSTRPRVEPTATRTLAPAIFPHWLRLVSGGNWCLFFQPDFVRRRSQR